MSNHMLYKGAIYGYISNSGNSLNKYLKDHTTNYITTYDITNNDIYLPPNNTNTDCLYPDYIVFKKTDNDELKFRFVIELSGSILIDFTNELIPYNDIKIVDNCYIVKIPKFIEPYLIINWKDNPFHIFMESSNMIMDLKMINISTIIDNVSIQKLCKLRIRKHIKYEQCEFFILSGF